ncbi:MAG TPA: hypothetical protein VGC36_11575 [Rhizomicrobium sp.]
MSEPGKKAFIRNAWYAAGFGAELEPGRLLQRLFLNEPVLPFRKEFGAAVIARRQMQKLIEAESAEAAR